SPVAPQDQSRRVHAERTAQSRSATPVLRANTHDSTRSAPPLGVGRPQTSTPPCPRPHLQNQPHPPLPTHQSWTCHHHDNLRRSPLHRPTTHRYRRIIHAPPTTISALTRRGRGNVSAGPEARQRGALACVVEYDFDRLADAHAVGITVDNVGQHPRPFFELDVREHVHARVAILAQVRL